MQAMTSGEIAQYCYENEVPDFAEPELERLYGSLFSSLAHFRLYGGAENAGAYVAKKKGEIATILLFRREKGTIRVINEWIRLGAEEISRFCEFMFRTFPSVTLIKFHAIEPETEGLEFPFQRCVYGENIVVDLPQTPEAYLAAIGGATRKNIKRHRNRLQRDFPSFEFRVYEKEEIDESHLKDIVAFNHARMRVKGKTSAIDESETARLLALARTHGLVAAASIGGRICAGTIMFRFGDNFVSRVNAHDPVYDDYRLGMISCYLGVCEAIRRGGREFHFMWGKYEYKTALLGVHKFLDDLLVYRSRGHMLLNGGVAVKAAIGGRSREARLRLLELAERSDTPMSRFLGKSLNAVKRMKRLGGRAGPLA